MTKIDIYYLFCNWLDILDYIIKLLKKNKFFYNKIKNISN